MVRFFPKEERFFDYFNEASEKILVGIRLLREMMLDLSAAADKTKKIKEVEHEADRITHETISKLHQTFITPIDREFIHSLITRMDDILDLIYAASERVLLYKLATSTAHALSLINTLERAIIEVAKGVERLRDLKDSKSILNICIEIHSLENEGDMIFRLALSDLFNSSFDATEIIKWKDIYETFEDAIDKCEDVANILEGIVLENA
jgi:predicted phosphate transport protein (TIGR00153 family)